MCLVWLGDCFSIRRWLFFSCYLLKYYRRTHESIRLNLPLIMEFNKFWPVVTGYRIWNSFWYNWLAYWLYKLIWERPNNRIHCHVIYDRSANFEWVDKFTVIHIQCTAILWIWSLRFIPIWCFWRFRLFYSSRQIEIAGPVGYILLTELFWA